MSRKDLSRLSFSFRIIPLTPSPSYLFKPENNLSFRHPLLPRQIHFSNYTHDICLQSGCPVNFHTFLRACDFLLDISLTRLRVWGQVCAFKTPFSRYPSLISFPHNVIIKPILVRIERPRMPCAAPLCVHKRNTASCSYNKTRTEHNIFISIITIMCSCRNKHIKTRVETIEKSRNIIPKPPTLSFLLKNPELLITQTWELLILQCQNWHSRIFW